MSDKLWRQGSDLDGSDHVPGRAPGKVPVTARLAARPQPVVFRVESAEAGQRDANGVAPGADGAVDRASGSSGSALPTHLQSRFESSLGADLSGVRIHTGSESADAAQAVGARAYTTGQDIHFAAGQYDPSSAFGTHLLAHEVAHTVQQQGSEPTRQNKLEVSTPQDAAEHEADRAADSMIHGRSAHVSSGSGLRRKTIQRDQDQAADMEKQGDEGEIAASKQLSNVTTLNVSNVGDRTSAQIALRHLGESQSLLETGIQRGEPEGALEKYNQNTKVYGLLQTYVDANQVQAVATSNFQLLYKEALLDFARLNKIGTGYNGESLFDAKDEKGAKDQANAKLDAAGGGGAKMHDKLEKLKKANPKLVTQIENVKRLHTKLEGTGKKLVGFQGACEKNLNGFQGSLLTLSSACGAKASTEMKAAFDKTKAESDATKEIVGGIVSALVGGVKGAITEGPVAGGVEAAKGIGGVIWEQVKKEAVKLNEKLNIEAGYFPAPKNDDLAAGIADKASLDAVLGALKAVKSQRSGVGGSLDTFFQEMDTFQTDKEQYRSDMIELGRALDEENKKSGGAKKGDTSFSEMSVFVAEADTFIAQANVTLTVGKQELDVDNKEGAGHGNASSAHDAHQALGAVNTGSGQKVWMAYKWKATKYSGIFSYKKEEFEHIGAKEESLDIKTGANPTHTMGGAAEGGAYGSAETPMLGGKYGGNAIIATSLDELEKMKKVVKTFRDTIAAAVLG